MTREEVFAWLYSMVPCMSQRAVEAFEAHGWTCGGSSGRIFVATIGDFIQNFNQLIEMTNKGWHNQMDSYYSECGRCRVDVVCDKTTKVYVGTIAIVGVTLENSNWYTIDKN